MLVQVVDHKCLHRVHEQLRSEEDTLAEHRRVGTGAWAEHLARDAEQEHCTPDQLRVSADLGRDTTVPLLQLGQVKTHR